MKSLKIALLGKYFGWGGGCEFLRIIANGLLSKKNEYNISLFLLLPKDNIKYYLRVIKKSVIESFKSKKLSIHFPKHAFDESIFDYFENVSGYVKIIYHNNTKEGLLRCLKRIGADIALPVNGSLGDDFPVPWIGYIPDFQHKYYPNHFDSRECFDRDIHFAKVFRDSKTVIVNSISVKNDIVKYFPYTKAEVFALPFSPIPVDSWWTDDACHVADKFNLPDKYFLVSNQFWIHKDHLAVFKALSIIVHDHPLYIVCTGKMEDYRHPGYIEELRSFLRMNNLKNRVRFLGHIAKREQIEIMKNAVALVQPTLFEGGPGGGSVYDAVSMGIPVILSDIEINREVDADNIYFFEAGNSEDLADKMKALLNMEINQPSKNDLLARGQKRAEKLGEKLIMAVQHAMHSFKKEDFFTVSR